MQAVLTTPTFKALSALLTYPTGDLVADAAEIRTLLDAEGLVSAEARHGLEALLDDLATADLYDLQERYVDLFDKTRRCSLYLFEHVHGESRDRGQAMVDLAALYARGGLTPDANELPDYLPLFLEYLATRPLEEARGLLGDVNHILSAVEEKLAKRDTTYAAIFAAIRSVAGMSLIPIPADAAPETAGDDLAALDAAWEETAVTFGPGESGDGCSAERLRIRMRAMTRDVQPLTA